MPSLHIQREAPLSPADPGAGERFTRTLVGLTRTVWHDQCTFDTALGAICEGSATAMQVERVSAWQYDLESGVLRCIQAYDGVAHRLEDPQGLEVLSLEGDDYIAALQTVRAFEATDIDSHPVTAGSHTALREYLRHRRIHALLDAPAFVGGKLQAVLCHESVDRLRQWTPEEVTFAASMGDYVAMAYEIARRRSAEAEVEHLRLHDAGTGLPNREFMLEQAAQGMARVRGPTAFVAVLHVLVDASGGVAWSAGAPTLDDVVATIAQRLLALASDTVTIGRVRGNGLALFLVHVASERGAIRFAERSLEVLRTLEWDHEEVDPSVTIGIAFAGTGDEGDARVLLRRAEEAAEQARGTGKFSYAVFDAEHHAALVEALHFERSLRDAFAAGEFEVHYQPEYDAEANAWVAAESLLRWRSQDRLICAGEFIAIVESSGMMLDVGRWVLRQACRDAAQWPVLPGGEQASVRVNVSARQFDEDGLVSDVRAALTQSGLDPSRLCLELTETTLMRDIDHALDVLQPLKQMGVKVAIDDFGTGYASLVYLKRLPVDVLKIDRSFVEGMPGNNADTAIVKAVVGLAGSLGIDVIAEGVERDVQQRALQAIGVRRMQGWLYGKAMPQADLCRIFRG